MVKKKKIKVDNRNFLFFASFIIVFLIYKVIKKNSISTVDINIEEIVDETETEEPIETEAEEPIVDSRPDVNFLNPLFLILIVIIIVILIIIKLRQQREHIQQAQQIQQDQKLRVGSGRKVRQIPNFYEQLTRIENAFTITDKQILFAHNRIIYNIEKVIHMWPTEGRPHIKEYSNDLWIDHQNYLIATFENKEYRREDIQKLDYFVQKSIIRACLFIFYDYLLNRYPYILDIFQETYRSEFLYIIFVILVQSNNVNFIIANHSDTIKSISNKLKYNITLQQKPLTVSELTKNPENDMEYMRKFSQNDRSLIKIGNRLYGSNRNWNYGIWESHPEWSTKDSDISMILDSLYNQSIEALTVDEFLKKYEEIYNLIYN